MKNIELINEFLKKGSALKTTIITHHKPDADALGSSLGLYHFLKTRGIEATVISPTDYGSFLHWMPGNEIVLNFELVPEPCSKAIEESDLIFCLDFNDLKRINDLGPLVRASKAEKVLIDHHLQPEGFDDYRLWSTKASSTCELIYEFILTLGSKEDINKEIASCLYAGIMTDTGSFRHNTTTPTTHRVVADLVERGADSARIHEQVYDCYSESRTRFIGFSLHEKLTIIPEYNTAYMAITAEELKRFQIVTGDTEGLVNYGLSIGGIKLSVLIVDRTKAIKMSFRSKDNVPANEIARKHFSGGGHFNAAGGESHLTLEETVKKLLEVLPLYSETLQH